jgi:DNA-binding MarR family transcriptional regulator
MRITDELRERISETRSMIAEFEESSKRNPFFVIARILGLGPTTLRELCEISGLRNDSVSQYLNRLRKQGKVTRQLDEGKKRGAKYVLTSNASTVPQEMGKPQEMSKAMEMGKAHVDPSNSEYPLAG